MKQDETRPGNGNATRHVIEWFRLITPALVMICLFILGSVNTRLGEIDNKIFVHLTNHELHIPRQDVVTQAEFQLHCQFSDDAKARFEEAVNDMKIDMTSLLTEIRANNNGGGK